MPYHESIKREITPVLSESKDDKILFHVKAVIPVFEPSTRGETYYDEETTEVFQRNAFDKADMSAIKLLLEHSNPPLTSTNSTLKVEITDNGIEFEADVPKNPFAEQALSLIKNGDIKGASFAGDWDTYSKQEGKGRLNTVTEVIRMRDVSLVVFPSFKESSIQTRGDSQLAMRKSTRKKVDNYRADEIKNLSLGALALFPS